MKVRFWGVRGSVPTPGPRTVGYGGNTSCVEVEDGDDRLILDAGTGICELGRQLVQEGRPVDVRLLITHSHMDHIQGFPFFLPAFIAGNRIQVFGPKDVDKGIYDIMCVQMDYSVFPVRVDQLAADVVFHDVLADEFDVDPFSITTAALNHPILTLGYRIERGGQTVVYAPDHEPYQTIIHRNLAAGLDEQAYAETVETQTTRIRRFFDGADLLILDSQYTPEEYDGKTGWGHSTWRQTVDLALAASVGHLVLFHHEPTRDDADLEAVLDLARAHVAGSGSEMAVSLAREGWTCDLA